MKEASSYADDLSAVLEMNDGSNMVDAILRRHVVFGGTQVIQHTYENMSELMEGVKEKPKIAPPPDEGCPAVVLRTGFATTQGQLMRTILFASETVHGSGWQTAVFILILLVFAVVASAYVLIEVG
jgi:cation-transporting ATPase 13A1